MKIESIIDGLLSQANYNNVELIVEQAFGDDTKQFNNTVIIQNKETGKFGIIATHVKEFPDDDICFFEFNERMYKYCKAEGFEREDMMKSFDGRILVKLCRNDFFEFIFRKQ
tara:strand:- start:659 stop:994 length:336 start_codon:yes stop_codon:yes gene_type:complete